jgi:uncharacterized protein YbjT (DUF2867 family)
MNVFIIGITGGIGGLLAEKLRSRGDAVHGLVRRHDQQAELETRGMNARVGDLSSMTVEEIAATFGEVDAIVFSAGSNGGSKEVTNAIDGDGSGKRSRRHASPVSSALPWCQCSRNPGANATSARRSSTTSPFKKDADIAVSRSDLNWLILRPSLVLDGPGVGTVSLGPAESHGQIARDDVAGTLAELLYEPRIDRQILELNAGSTPIEEAVRANLRACWIVPPWTLSTA